MLRKNFWQYCHFFFVEPWMGYYEWYADYRNENTDLIHSILFTPKFKNW